MVELISNKGPDGKPLTDTNGNPIEGARVIAYHTGGEFASDGDTFVTYTDPDGLYAFTDSDLPATYKAGESTSTDYVHLFAEIGGSGSPRQAVPIRPWQAYSLESSLDRTDLVHEYDARELSGFSEGDSVSTFSDTEGSNDATGSGTYRASQIGGNPAVELNGVGDSFDTASSWNLGTGGAYTFACVVQLPTISGTDYNELVRYDGGGYGVSFRDDSVSGSNGDKWSAFHTGQFADEHGSPSAGVAVLVQAYDGDQLIVDVDGTESYGQTGKSISSPSGVVGFGYDIRNNSRYAQTWIGHYLHYDAYKNGSERDSITSDLQSAWGI